ncbi:hypothetical protein [Streptomyces sp. NPDC088847]|uniref:hypothetical protein n=1 Tax=Streptomyces sp. NPDC088847 TaxID=3365909 RepID=UPI00380B64A0
MSALLLDVMTGLVGAVVGVALPAVLVGVAERALPFLSLPGADRAEAAVDTGLALRGVR